jgi:hypothetical protein
MQEEQGDISGQQGCAVLVVQPLSLLQELEIGESDFGVPVVDVSPVEVLASLDSFAPGGVERGVGHG